MKIRGYLHKIRDVWELSWSLAKAEFKLRNEGTYLGIFWYLLEPLLMFLIIFLISKRINPMIPNYPLYLLTGLVMFNFFSGTTREATTAITGNSGFIKSRKLNYESLVLSRVLRAVFSHFFEIIVIVIFIIYFKSSLIGLIFYPILLLLFTLFSVGVSLFLSALGVYINDLVNIWRVLLRLLWFATPIFYAIEESSIQFLFNPLAHFIGVGRYLIAYGQIPPLWMILSVIIIPIFSLLIGGFIFNKFKKEFAERI